MVRLKDALPQGIGSLSVRFQFQYGAIKGDPVVLNMGQYYGFNSSMVRLKAFVGEYRSYDEASFNSSMVRLKEYNNISRNKN